MTSRIQAFKNQFIEIFDGNPWLDETFFKKLNNLSETQAFAQAPGNNHSVAEVVSHIIEWRKEIIRRLTDNSSERMLTGESPDDWKPVGQLQQIGWQQLYADFTKSQQQLLNLLQGKDDNFLDSPNGESGFNNEYLVAGLLHHDLYHLGQIGLILKWARQ